MMLVRPLSCNRGGSSSFTIDLTTGLKGLAPYKMLYSVSSSSSLQRSSTSHSSLSTSSLLTGSVNATISVALLRNILGLGPGNADLLRTGEAFMCVTVVLSWAPAVQRGPWTLHGQEVRRPVGRQVVRSGEVPCTCMAAGRSGKGTANSKPEPMLGATCVHTHIAYVQICVHVYLQASCACAPGVHVAEQLHT